MSLHDISQSVLLSVMIIKIFECRLASNFKVILLSFTCIAI